LTAVRNSRAAADSRTGNVRFEAHIGGMSKVGLPIESFIMERLADGGWRVTERRADLTDIPIADFVSLRDAEEWLNWKSGKPKVNPYAK
jgi:hypothetical protein